MASQRRLIIPTSHQIHGTPPKFGCTLCPAVFTADERHQFERHVLGHTQEELLAHSPRHNHPAFYDDYDPRYNDVEWQRWIDRMKVERPGEAWRWMKTDEGKH